jgi:uncharacterized protein (DUF305 family)
MTSNAVSFVRRFLAGLVLAIGATSFGAAGPPIVQPGAPGEPSRELDAEKAVQIADSSYSPADVRFMTDMIPHHHQAVVMSAMVAERTNRPELVDLAGRIDATQADEIAFMQDWLRERGQPVPDPTAHHAMHTSHDMAGMATPEQLAQLQASKDTAFDRLFLQLMIPHHEGAVTMVEELLEQPGSAHDPVLFEFTNDITNDQTAEIERMNALLASLSDDPRANLEPGFLDAGQALLNLELIASLPKPPGFFDPENPAGLPPKRQERFAEEEEEVAADPHGHGHQGRHSPENFGHGDRKKKGHANPEADPEEDPEEEDGVEEEADDDDGRSPLLSFVNTDMAFADNVLVAGNYHGFNIYELDDDGRPELVSSVVCPGGQGDVSIVGDLLIMSGGRQPRTVPRPAHPRHQRPEPAGAGRRGPDLPRVAHPLGGVRARRGRQDHRVQLRHRVGARGRGASGLLRRDSGRRPHGAVPDRRRRDPGGQPGGVAHRREPRGLRR